MRKYLEGYINEVENTKDKKVIEELKTKITFFQHERLIHLIIMMSFVLFSIIFTCLSLYTKSNYMLLVTLILYVMDIFYIIH